MTLRLLDTFCGAGGCSVGYSRAGFEVVGVDNEAHASYPYEMRVADAIEVLRDEEYLAQFDVVHASPPCQRYSSATGAGRDKHPDFVPVVRELLQEWGGVYIIENVMGAPMTDAVRVCGSAFGLKVRRHRLFESNAPIAGTPCFHRDQGQPVGVYGQHADTREYLRPDGTRRGSKARSLEEGQAAMGIDWMDWKDLTEAIPPAYAEWIGKQVHDHLLSREGVQP